METWQKEFARLVDAYNTARDNHAGLRSLGSVGNEEVLAEASKVQTAAFDALVAYVERGVVAGPGLEKVNGTLSVAPTLAGILNVDLKGAWGGITLADGSNIVPDANGNLVHAPAVPQSRLLDDGTGKTMDQLIKEQAQALVDGPAHKAALKLADTLLAHPQPTIFDTPEDLAGMLEDLAALAPETLHRGLRNIIADELFNTRAKLHELASDLQKETLRLRQRLDQNGINHKDIAKNWYNVNPPALPPGDPIGVKVVTIDTPNGPMQAFEQVTITADVQEGE
jgi:hypothetical protein